MGQEIERKFLVQGEDFLESAKVSFELKQGYIHSEPGKTIRVRTSKQVGLPDEAQGFITVKGKTQGISRLEYEYEIPYQEAVELLEHFCNSPVEKQRYLVPVGSHLWEIDVFRGNNTGLTLAEIELESEDEEFEKPQWLSKEVSEDFRYANSRLAENPYTSWASC